MFAALPERLETATPTTAVESANPAILRFDVIERQKVGRATRSSFQRYNRFLIPRIVPGTHINNGSAPAGCYLTLDLASNPR